MWPGSYLTALGHGKPPVAAAALLPPSRSRGPAFTQLNRQKAMTVYGHGYDVRRCESAGHGRFRQLMTNDECILVRVRGLWVRVPRAYQTAGQARIGALGPDLQVSFY